MQKSLCYKNYKEREFKQRALRIPGLFMKEAILYKILSFSSLEIRNGTSLYMVLGKNS